MRNEKGQFVKGSNGEWLGRKHSKEACLKMSTTRTGKVGPWAGKKRPEGELSTHWKGEKVGYNGVHDWVRKMLGRPTECSECGRVGLTQRKIHWASISHQCKRDLSDWVRLCAKCHKNYDLNKIQLTCI